MEDIQTAKKIPLSDLHAALGAKMVPFAGFLMPVRYSSDIEEHSTVRKGVGVFDVSHMGEFIVEGPQALDLIQYVTSNDASKLTPGKAQYSCFPNAQGGIVDDILVYCLEENQYMLVVNASNIEKDWNWINSFNKFDTELQNISDQVCLFAVQGPDAVKVLQKLTPAELSEIPYYSFVVDEFAGIPGVIISATGYTGAGGFELYVPVESAENVWKEIFKAGEEFNIKPIGLGARDTLRLEVGYCLYGNDITDETSPLEAGLGWITKTDKDFVGKDKIMEQKKSGVPRKLVGFMMEERGVPRSQYDIVNAEKEVIGKVTSGTQSPSLGKGIGLGYVVANKAVPGTEVFVSIRNTPIKAKIVKLPFLKKGSI